MVVSNLEYASAAIATEGTAVGSYTQRSRHIQGPRASGNVCHIIRVPLTVMQLMAADMHGNRKWMDSLSSCALALNADTNLPLFMSQLQSTTVRGSKNRPLSVLRGNT